MVGLVSEETQRACFLPRESIVRSSCLQARQGHPWADAEKVKKVIRLAAGKD